MKVENVKDISVSKHALMRFRDRYLTPSEREDLDDVVVAHWLNALVRTAQSFEDILDEERPARIVEIRGRRQGSQPSYAVIREQGTPDATIVTLLSAWMRDQNRRRRWRTPAGERISETTTGRTERLRGSLGAMARVR